MRKVSIDMSRVMEEMKNVAPRLGEMRIILEETHDRIIVGDEIPEGMFAFTLPEAAEFVKLFDFEKLPLPGEVVGEGGRCCP